ncbi:hypothetical protein A0256_08950 [Mucilaginibacter sp. PAMC 26640]|nr:hypothetical protein A0256_08950 [Mucilaginibacter sp. PAMC 26640]
MKNNDAQFQLPSKRRLSFTERLESLDSWFIVTASAVLYVAAVMIFSCIEYSIGVKGNFKDELSGFWELVYFNFISILTIGYGDVSPLGYVRVLTIIEAIIGLTIYTLSISVITLKLLLPARHTIVFSKYAYYSTDDEAFMIIYLNTAKQFITNLETTWYFKLNEDWKTGSPSRVPFITRSVQTFYLGYGIPVERLVAQLHSYDCLRVGLSGDLGMTRYSTYVQYDLEDILVIENRDELKNYEGFYQVDEHWQSDKFSSYFHYRPKDAATLAERLKSRVS